MGVHDVNFYGVNRSKDSDVVFLDRKKLFIENLDDKVVLQIKSVRVLLNEVLEIVDQQVELKQIVLLVLHCYVPDSIDPPNIGVSIIMEVKEVLVGRVDYQPNYKQVRVVLAVDVDVVQLQVVVVKVVIFTMYPVKRIVKVYLVLVLSVVVVVCRVASV